MNTQNPLQVLLVDDDVNIRRTLSLSLSEMACSVTEADNVTEALKRFGEKEFDLVLTDFRMEKQSGSDLVREVRALRPETIVVVMTAFASIENAVSVIKEGAFDYLSKPFTEAQMNHLLTKVRLLVSLRSENKELKRAKSRGDYFAGFTSPAGRRLEEFIRKIAPAEATVLLVGESGTGKSELAKLIHGLSPRAAARFVTVQCTSLTESLLESELFGHVKGAFTGATRDKKGKLEHADGGTLFLDEIGDLPLPGQTKLLRFLQEKIFEAVGSNEEIHVDARVIAATNRNLEEAVKQGRFREDLYYRLNILECSIVPLRFRQEDIPVLIQRFLKEMRPRNQPTELSANVMSALLAYPWPGNIRELRNALERILMLSQGREPLLEDLPEAVRSPPVVKVGPDGPIRSLDELEREHIGWVLSREQNLEKAAQALGITTVTLWRKRKEYGLS